MSWRTRPEPIPAEQIKESFDYEVVVVGLGYAGTAAFRASVEEGAKTVGLEFQDKKSYMSYGRDVGHINSEFLAKRGVPHVDELEFFNDWMNRSGNRANPELVMKYATGGKNFDWFVDMYTDEEMESTRVAFWDPINRVPAAPEGKERLFKKQQGNYKFWIGTARFRAFIEPQHPQVQEVVMANQDKAVAEGGTVVYEIEVTDIIKENGRVCGVIAKDKEGNYYRYNASKAVVIAAGDFGANPEMCEELLPDMKGLFVEGDKFKGASRKGRSIQLGLWAGGRLEAGPIATMGGNYNNIAGLTGCHGFLWLDADGKRFCNENAGDPVMIGLAGVQKKRGTFYKIFDSGVWDDLLWASFSHMTFEWEEPDTVAGLKGLIDSAIENSPEPSAPAKVGNARGSLYAARTIEDMADKCLKLTGELRDNFVASYYRYNEIARSGRDTDFGKESQLLRPLDKEWIFCEPMNFGPIVGMIMATCGGLVTDGNQNVLDANYEKVPGLYATGNCCGRRFGIQYSTPISGVCNGMAIILGREAGKAAATL